MLTSKRHSPLKGARLTGEMADSRVGAGKVQDSLEHFVCQKAKKCSQNEEDMFKKKKTQK